MDNQRVARELVAMARELTAGRTESGWYRASDETLIAWGVAGGDESVELKELPKLVNQARKEAEGVLKQGGMRGSSGLMRMENVTTLNDRVYVYVRLGVSVLNKGWNELRTGLEESSVSEGMW